MGAEMKDRKKRPKKIKEVLRKVNIKNATDWLIHLLMNDGKETAEEMIPMLPAMETVLETIMVGINKEHYTNESVEV